MGAKRNPIKDIGVGTAVLLALFVVLFVFLFSLVWLIKQLESQVAVAVTAASVTAIASVLAIVISKHFERRSQIIGDIRSKKIPVYEDLISMIFKVMFAEKSGGKRATEKEIQKFFADMTPKLIIWGSQEVISAWNRIRSHDWVNARGPDILGPWEDLWLAIRKDIGNSSSRLKQGDLMRLFINNFPDE